MYQPLNKVTAGRDWRVDRLAGGWLRWLLKSFALYLQASGLPLTSPHLHFFHGQAGCSCARRILGVFSYWWCSFGSFTSCIMAPLKSRVLQKRTLLRTVSHVLSGNNQSSIGMTHPRLNAALDSVWREEQRSQSCNAMSGHGKTPDACF